MNKLQMIINDSQFEGGLFALEEGPDAGRTGRIFPFDEVDEEHRVPVECVVRLSESYEGVGTNEKVALVYAVDSEGHDTGRFEVRTFDGKILGVVD